MDRDNGLRGFESDNGLIFMATISSRDDADTLDDGDHFIVRQPSATGTKTRKITFGSLKDQIPGTGGGGGSTVYAGSATLASGTVTVDATWVTADSVIVVTPTAAPGVPGSTLYIENVVAATSFDITSEDITDSRAVFWMSTELNPAGLYFTWRVKFDTDEVTDGAAAGSADMLNVHQDAGADDTNTILYTWFNWPSGTPANTANFGTWSTGEQYPLTIVADSYYVMGARIRLLDAGASGYEITAYVDGVEQTPFTDPTVRTGIGSFDFGGRYAPTDNVKRSFDYLKVGTTGWGSSDIFDADFASAIVPPFDSTVSGGNLSIVSGNLLVDVPGGGTDAYAIKDL